MEQYPNIPGSKDAPLGKDCIAFVKYDGSNLRWEWQPKRGWCKSGTRHELFDLSTNELWAQAIPLFYEISDDIVTRIRNYSKHYRSIQRITAFTEFFGPSSFAGKHVLEEKKQLKLIDVYLYKVGMIPPRQFVEIFGDASYAAEVVYHGKLNASFIEDVKEAKYPGFEGVVAKGEDFRVKIKTRLYFMQLQEVFGRDYSSYWE